MGFLQCHKKSISWTMNGRMRCSGRVYWSWSKHKRLCWVQLHPAMKEVRPCFHQAQKKRQGSRDFVPCKSLVQFSSCPSPAIVVFIPSCTRAGAALLCSGSHLGVCVASRPTWLLGRDCEWMVECVLPSEKKQNFVKLQLYYLTLGKNQALFQTKQSISQSFRDLAVGSSP